MQFIQLSDRFDRRERKYVQCLQFIESRIRFPDQRQLKPIGLAFAKPARPTALTLLFQFLQDLFGAPRYGPRNTGEPRDVDTEASIDSGSFRTSGSLTGQTLVFGRFALHPANFS